MYDICIIYDIYDLIYTMAHRGHVSFAKFCTHNIRLLHTKSIIVHKLIINAQTQGCCAQI